MTRDSNAVPGSSVPSLNFLARVVWPWRGFVEKRARTGHRSSEPISMKFDRHEGSNISHPHTKFQPSPFLGSPATADTTLPRAQRGLGAGFSGRNTRSKRSQSRKSAEKAVFIGKTFLFANRFGSNLLHSKKTLRCSCLPFFSVLPSSVRPP